MSAGASVRHCVKIIRVLQRDRIVLALLQLFRFLGTVTVSSTVERQLGGLPLVVVIFDRRILSEAGFSNKDIRDRFCLNGSFSDRATVAKRLGAALGKDTNPPRGKGKEAAAEWCETNRDDFDNYQAFFGKRPPDWCG